ncbi:MAG: rod shape-determining protein MreD [Acidimicrobiales bacterium]
MSSPLVRYFLVIASAAFLQYALVTQFRVAGVSADLLLVVAIAAGINAGVERGAVVGFASGICLDLLVTTPFGLCAIAGLVAGVVAGSLEAATVHSARWLTMVITFTASASGVIAFALTGALMGRPSLWSGHVLTIIAILGVTSAFLVFPAIKACRWADPEDALLRPALR